MGGPIKRGAFIVLEGCDRSGKSTQSRLLAEYLKSKDIPVKSMGFPARSSDIGKVINSYLSNAENHTDEVIHLLFSANRWEFKNEMKTLLESGTTLIVDRYSYSGVAYSAAKGLDYDWCMAPEKGLLRPDMVFYLNTSIDVLTSRGNFGKERYEKNEFQCQVAEVFNRIYTKEKDYWHEFDASLALDLLHQKLSEKTVQVLSEVQSKPLRVLQ